MILYLDAQENVVRQDEDVDYDGTFDRRFEGDAATTLSGEAVQARSLGKLDCGAFDDFWKRN